MSDYADGGIIEPQEKDRDLPQDIASTWEEMRPIKPDPARMSTESKKLIEALMKENQQ